jgi:pSer/pThr/pTyr-binding forkhead associated (FHA) protein
LPDPSVSHRHATLRQRGTEYVVIDEGSTNGTFVGPMRLSPQAPRLVRSGDLIRIGRVWLELRLEHVVPTQQPQVVTSEIALALVASALSAENQASALKVTVSAGPDAGLELAIGDFERPHVLGRSQSADLVLTDVDASRRHVQLVRRGTRLYVCDLGSKNGTSVGGERLPSQQEVPWRTDAPLQVGQNHLTYEDPVIETLAELERVADERMQEDEPIEPPAGVDSSGHAAAPGDDASTASVATRKAPIAALPKRATTTAASSTGWNISDVLVAMLALLVLALSIIGLFWLFRS